MIIQRGSLVECNYEFSLERQRYGYEYPHAGDLLTVRGFMRDPESGETLLTFEELSLPVGVFAYHFFEIQTPEEGDAAITKVKKVLTQ